jgi:hypothetical protein
MKCPKCNYVSFDYNQTCPKCGKDISVEQEKLNIPAFKPAPPSLLGGLLGEAHPGGSGDMPETDQPSGISLEDASRVAVASAELDDSQEIDLGLELHEDREGLDLEGILEKPEPGIEPGDLLGDSSAAKRSSEGETEIVGTISLEESEVFPVSGEGKTEEQDEISLELEEITMESAEPEEEKGVREPPEEMVEADLGDFSLEDAGISLEEKSEPPLSDTGALALDLGLISEKEGNAPAANEQDEITLSLDDLQVNETGQLEIGRNIAAISRAKEAAARTEAPRTEPRPETPVEPEEKEAEDDLSLLLADDAIEVSSDPGESVQTLDLENLDLELDLEGPERK